MFAAWGFLTVVLMVSPIAQWSVRLLSGPMDEPVGDVLIVPAGNTGQWAVLGASTYWRCTYAVAAWQTGRYQAIVVSGGRGAGESMMKFLSTQGVPAGAITVEDKADSTRENAVFTEPLLASMPGRKVLLTSDFHMYRALRTFRRAGIHAVPYPIPDAAKRAIVWHARLPVCLELGTEAAKIVLYFLRGWI